MMVEKLERADAVKSVSALEDLGAETVGMAEYPVDRFGLRNCLPKRGDGEDRIGVSGNGEEGAGRD